MSSLAEYLECSLGMRQTLYPTVLGLKLAEDLDLGKRFATSLLVGAHLHAVHKFSEVKFYTHDI